MEIAISGQLLSGSFDLDSTLQTIAAYGVHTVELWPENLPGGTTQEERAGYRDRDLATTRRLLAEHGMSLACLTIASGMSRAYHTGGVAAATAALVDAVDAAAELASPRVNTYLAGLDPETFAQIVRPAARHAEPLGITLVLENEAHDDSGPASSVRAIIERIAMPNVGVLFDPCNFYQANDEPFPAAFEVLSDLIRYAHLKGGCHYRETLGLAHHRGGTLRDQPNRYLAYVAIEDSAFNPQAFLTALAATGYDGPITIEPHVPVAHATAFYDRDVAYLRDALARIPTAAPAVA